MNEERSLYDVEKLAGQYYFGHSAPGMPTLDWITAKYADQHLNWLRLAEDGMPRYYWLLGISFQTEGPWKYLAKDKPHLHVPPSASEADAASMPQFEKGAKSGCKYCQYGFAQLLAKQKDEGCAFDWHLASAEQGFSKAMHAVGLCYRNVRGVAEDFDQAFAWVSRATDQGRSHRPLLTLALFFRDGVGVAADNSEAKKRLEELRRRGHMEAEL